MSKKITLSVDGATATVTEAKLGDIVGTMVSSDVKLTGGYGFLQSLAWVALGAVAESKKRGGGFLPSLVGGE